MGYKEGIIFISLVLGCLAIPTPESVTTPLWTPQNPESRIVGGNVAAEGSHPHLGALSSGLLISSFLCGGSIVSSRSFLTAAHCIDHVFSFGSLSSSLRLTVGTNTWNRGGQDYRLSGNATHPHYVASTLRNDIGLLFTSTPIVYSPTVSPVSMEFETAEAGLAVRVAGWGRINVNAGISAVVREVDLFVYDDDKCIVEVAEASILFNTFAPPVEPHIELCTFLETDIGTCRGDSGSPLLRIDRGTQIGVVSWGFACARGAPDMHARVSFYQDWLLDNLRI